MKIITLSFLFALLISLSGNQLFAGTEGMPGMPVLQPKKSEVIKDGSKLETSKGFGDHAPEVRMMNLMMVEGSGMEGMAMEGMAPVSQQTKTNQSPSESQPTTTATTTTTAKSDALPISNYVVKFEPLKSPAKVAFNLLTVIVLDVHKHPATHLALKAEVSMTEMNMGVEEPEVHESAPGRYQFKAPFAMKGKWAVKVVLPDHSSAEQHYDVEVSP
jgi:hypothetical protein